MEQELWRIRTRDFHIIILLHLMLLEKRILITTLADFGRVGGKKKAIARHIFSDYQYLGTFPKATPSSSRDV